MGTLVCFHAHPDDEAIATGGVIARAAAAGHRVVLVVATDGRHGEAPDDLAAGETLADRRRAETERSAAILGIARVAWLGYADSGMTGWEQNHEPEAFWQADVEEAAERLAGILREEAAHVVTTYDWHGVYGHPDHVMVHRVGRRAAESTGARLLEATMNRDHLRRLSAMAAEVGIDTEGDDFDVDAPADDGNPFGMPEAEVHLAVDVSAFLAAKRASVAAHGSQVTDTSFFVTMPDEAFSLSFGTEWFVEPGRPPGMRHGWIFDE